VAAGERFFSLDKEKQKGATADMFRAGDVVAQWTRRSRTGGSPGGKQKTNAPKGFREG